MALRSTGVRSGTAMAAAEDAAALCGSSRSGRGRGRGDGRGGRGGRGGRADGRGGLRGERDTGGGGGQNGHDGNNARVEGSEAATRRAQAESKAEAAPEAVEVEERWLREARRRADRALAKASAVAPSRAAVEAARRVESAGKVAAAINLQPALRGAAVRRPWRHVLAVLARYRAGAKEAVLAAEAAATSEVEAQRWVAEAAGLAETTAASRVEAVRLESEEEWEEMAAALVRQAVWHTVEAETRVAARRLVVVEASSEDADTATQTDPVKAAAVGTQTAVFSLGQRMVAAAVQTESCGTDGLAEPVREVVVGRQLHPAQAKAVERAERAAERVEQLQAAAEATAARYRAEGAAAQETAPTAAITTTTALSEVPRVAVGSGGKQRKKAQLRRQAAAEGMDVRAWAASKAERRRHLLAEAWEGMLAPGVEGFDQRIAWAQEDRMARRQAGRGMEEYGGEVEASRSFWEAAGWRGEGSRFSVLDAVEGVLRNT